ncbi:MAG TPA: hypothetical protein VMT89_09455 [Candidatus Acidoferrales bacterium]|nr:hypothetical protein [Candidatus Acidoferrales bacterium]
MMLRRIILIGLTCCVLSRAAVAEEGDYPSELGWGTLAVVSNLFYMPVKLVYAVAGGVTGSLAWLLTVGDTDTAEKIWAPSLGGSYVVTPKMLQDEEPIHFSGSVPQSN